MEPPRNGTWPYPAPISHPAGASAVWKAREPGFIEAHQEFHQNPFVFSVVGSKQAVEVHVRQSPREGDQILLNQSLVEGFPKADKATETWGEG